MDTTVISFHYVNYPGHALYYDFSLGYALSWALFFEGIFSSIYHLCPSRLIFQFDTNFMFLIGALTIACVFHGNSITQQTLLLLQRYDNYWSCSTGGMAFGDEGKIGRTPPPLLARGGKRGGESRDPSRK